MLLLQANQLAAKAAADAAADVDKAEAQQKSASAQSVPSTQPAAAGSWGVNFLKVHIHARQQCHIDLANDLHPLHADIHPAMYFVWVLCCGA